MPHPIFTTPFTKVYPLDVQKAERNGCMKDEVDRILCWLTGCDAKGLQRQVEAVEDPLMRKIRTLDKLVDERAEGRAMEKILRA